MRLHPLVVVAGVWMLTLGAWVLVPRSRGPAHRAMEARVPFPPPAAPAYDPAVG